MGLIKKMQIGNSNIEIYSDVTEDEKRENLKEVYKTINNIARTKKEQGQDVSNWFYTEEQLRKMEQDTHFKFI